MDSFDVFGGLKRDEHCMTKGPVMLELPQDRETPLQKADEKAFSYRYASSRAFETRAAGDCSEDYLALRYSERTFAFSLCDGVGQSFFGDLAARYLGKALIDWTWNNTPRTVDAGVVSAVLSRHLNALTREATRLISSHPLPPGIPGLLKEVLEQKRARGSESTFVCGRLDLPGSEFPCGRICLAWLGDSRVRLWGPKGEHSLGADLFKTEERWSTRRGPVGRAPHVFSAPLVQDGSRLFSALLAYTDGLTSLDSYEQTPTAPALLGLINEAQRSPYSDDITILDLSWRRGLAF